MIRRPSLLLPLVAALLTCNGCAVMRGLGEVAGMSDNQLDALDSAADDMDAATSDASLKDERDLGETVALQAYASEGFGRPVRDSRIMRFVNTLAAVVGRYSDRPLIPYFVAVIDTPKINAFATPGGYIFITKGAIMAMKSEAELACVIGHEIAHITERHALGTIQRTRVFSALGKSFAAAADADYEEFDAMVKDLCSSILNDAFDQDDELDADVKGVSFALDAGYDPRAMFDFIATISRNTAHLTGGLSSHPDAEDRREAIEEWLEDDVKAYELEGLVKTTERFREFQTWFDSPREDW
jgi:predicted Zn-dependent protease